MRAETVSIVVPSHRMGETLRVALDSLLAQTHRAIEILVLDNNSDDATPEILRAYRDRLGHVSTEPDRGQADALRRGFARARGEILGWLNADDLLMPDAIARVVAAFDGPDRPDVVYGHCALLDREGQFLRYFHEIEPFSADRLRSVIDFVAQPSTFFRRDVYEASGGIDDSLDFAMDWDLWCRMASRGGRFYFLDDVLSGARHYPTTKTASGGLRRWREILRVNRNYGTTRIPIAALVHLYGDLLRPHLRWAHGPIRHCGRRWLGERLRPGREILGLRPDRTISSTGLSLRFPVHRDVIGGRMRVESDSAIRVEGRLDGQSLTAHPVPESSTPCWELRWRWPDPRRIGAVSLDLMIEAASAAPPPTTRLIDVQLDFAQAPGGRGPLAPSNPRGSD